VVCVLFYVAQPRIVGWLMNDESDRIQKEMQLWPTQGTSHVLVWRQWA